MGESKRRNQNRRRDPDAKVVAVRDMRIDFPIPMRKDFMRTAMGNVRVAANAVRSEQAFDAFLRDLFALQKVVMVCYEDRREPGGIGVIVAKGLDTVLDDIKTADRETAWTSFVVNDLDSAYLLGMEYGDMAMVSVPFDSANDDETEAALDKARDLADYELAKKRA